MSNFSGPAAKLADARLFGITTSPSLRRLQKTSRGELRQKARAEFWNQAQAAKVAVAAQAQEQQ